MVFEPNYSKVVSSVRRNIGITQSAVEVKLPTGDIAANKIYSSGARVTILNNSTSGREVSFGGVVDFQVIYDADGFRSLDYTAEFKDRLVSEQEVLGEVVLTSNVIDVATSIVNGGIRVVAIVETVIDVIENKDLKLLTSINGDNVYVSNKTLDYHTYIGKAYEKFDVAGDIRLDNAQSVLSVSPCVSLSRVVAKQNYLEVQGKVNIEICYKTGDNINNLESTNQVADFNWEIALEGVSDNDLVQSVIGVVSNEVKITSIAEDGGLNVDYLIPIAYSGYVFSKNQISVVDDLYSESNYLSVTCENFETTFSGTMLSFKDNIVGNSAILDTAPFIDDVLGVCNTNTMIASSRIVDDRLCVEGVTTATVLYYTKETNEITSVQVEMPFTVDERVSGDYANVVTMCLTNVSARSRRGKEIEVSADINIYADVFSLEESSAITNVVVGEEKRQEDCALVIYIAREGQTLWDIAKENSIDQDLILRQNSELELPIKAGDKIVLYKPNLMKF